MTDRSQPEGMEAVTTPLGSRYELIETIASGATGTVWRARIRATGELVAAKEIRAELATDAEVIDRFLRERRVLGSIQHPAVVRLRDLVVEGDRIGLVMDLVEGTDLRTTLALGGPFDPEAALILAATVADALAAAHAAGVVHADVKPANVLVPADDQPVRLADFGVARLVHGPAPLSYGTPEYIAPEVILGHASIPASDVYGLAIMLYELLTGSTPYRGGTSAEVMQRHITARPIWTSAVPEAVRSVLIACLHRDPMRRPSAESLARDLRALAPELVGHGAAIPLPAGSPHFRLMPVDSSQLVPVEPDDSVTSVLAAKPGFGDSAPILAQPNPTLPFPAGFLPGGDLSPTTVSFSTPAAPAATTRAATAPISGAPAATAAASSAPAGLAAATSSATASPFASALPAEDAADHVSAAPSTLSDPSLSDPAPSDPAPSRPNSSDPTSGGAVSGGSTSGLPASGLPIPPVLPRQRRPSSATSGPPAPTPAVLPGRSFAEPTAIPGLPAAPPFDPRSWQGAPAIGFGPRPGNPLPPRPWGPPASSRQHTGGPRRWALAMSLVVAGIATLLLVGLGVVWSGVLDSGHSAGPTAGAGESTRPATSPVTPSGGPFLPGPGRPRGGSSDGGSSTPAPLPTGEPSEAPTMPQFSAPPGGPSIGDPIG